MPSRLLHVRSGCEVGEVLLQLEEHFKMVAAPVMIGMLMCSICSLCTHDASLVGTFGMQMKLTYAEF